MTSSYNHSSVPSEPVSRDNGAGSLAQGMGGLRITSTIGDGNSKHQDSILMYCSYFTYGKDASMTRRTFCESFKVSEIAGKLQQLESSKFLSQGSAATLTEFLNANDSQQRHLFDEPSNKKKAKATIRGFFEIVKSVKSDNNLIAYALAHLDGILEDNRARVQHYIAIMNEFKDSENVIAILNSFIHQNNIQDTIQRDIASHVLAILIAYTNFDKCHKEAREFLNYLTQQNDVNSLTLSVNAYTFALMTILKTNQLAREFSTQHSFGMIANLLEGPCLESPQVGYNVVCTLWILSYHDYTQKFFEDYTLAIIEKVAKIMDFFSWEKIARIMLMLIDNLKDISACQEHLSDIDVLNLIFKLQNRHWVDEDINKMLESLAEYFETN
mmetsp:Transcript_19642/g.30293  ORF Transcript_19642/g.30293 Transcript_19642/m.30293 type:complete len:384 (+) Transcript_19642:2-1153(+)